MPFHGLFRTPAIPTALQSGESANDGAELCQHTQQRPSAWRCPGGLGLALGAGAEQMGRAAAPLLSGPWRPRCVTLSGD